MVHTTKAKAADMVHSTKAKAADMVNSTAAKAVEKSNTVASCTRGRYKAHSAKVNLLAEEK